MRAIEKLKRWLDESGTRQAALAAEVGISQMRLSRVLSGKGSLPPAKLTAIEVATGIEGLALSLAAELPKGRARASKTPPPEPVAPPAPLEGLTEDELAALPGAIAERLGEPIAKPLFAVLVRLATSAKSEGVRRQAADSLADRICGKALQRVLDTTPKPPAENAELLLVLRQAAGEDTETPPPAEEGAGAQ